MERTAKQYRDPMLECYSLYVFHSFIHITRNMLWAVGTFVVVFNNALAVNSVPKLRVILYGMCYVYCLHYIKHILRVNGETVKKSINAFIFS